ncbi:MAG: DUF1080 domain-containing protein [Isosphaeraceae bacterium]
MSRVIGSLGVILSMAAVLSIEPLSNADDDTPSAYASDPKGWIDLLEAGGPDLTGWSRGSIPPSGALRAVTPSQWSLDPKSGILRCEGNGGHEWIRWDQELTDGIFHVEWRFVPAPGKPGYNSGVYARNSADGSIWHQAQTGGGNGGYLFATTPVDGMARRVSLAKERSSAREKPAGEWNTFELRFQGPELTLWVNGSVVNRYSKLEVLKGYVGLEAEGYQIEFRNVRLKRLDP